MYQIEKTEEQIAKERAAVEAMRNARSNMDAALSRIGTLERQLADDRRSIEYYKTFVPKSAYAFRGEKTLHDIMDEKVFEITKILGTSA